MTALSLLPFFPTYKHGRGHIYGHFLCKGDSFQEVFYQYFVWVSCSIFATYAVLCAFHDWNVNNEASHYGISSIVCLIDHTTNYKYIN
jgi:hypothetical protein